MGSMKSAAGRPLSKVAAEIVERTSRVAHADSRFGRDFSQFIPCFDGAEIAARNVVELPECRAAKRVFITPDNAVAPVRQLLIQGGVDLVVPSYGLHRGFLEVNPVVMPASAVPHSGWLDSIEHYGRSLTLDELAAGGAMDLVIAGAFAVTLQGLRFGMGDFYLDIEWAILRSLGVVTDQTLVIAVVHDAQTTAEDFEPLPTNVTADLIVTPSRTIRTARLAGRGRPSTLDWSIVPPSLMQTGTFEEFRHRSARA